MATTIITKNGTGTPLAGDLQVGELALDLTNKKLYSKEGTTVFEVGATGGGASGTFTDLTATNSFTSVGIDDNATSTAITIDSSENVGIGTASPQQMLHLSGAVPEIRYTDTTGNEYRAGNNNGKFRVYDQTAAADRLVIDSSGNVGIGTASPNEKLNVSGNIRVTSGFVSFSGSISTPSEAAAIFRPVDNTLAFSTANTERMRIDSSGNVVLGNTSTSFDFEIYRSGASSQLAITGGNASVSDLLMGDTDDNNIQRIRSDHSDNSMQFQVNNAERMRIDSSGKVGIGTASPDTLLHLYTSNNAGVRQNYITIEDGDTSASASNPVGGIEFVSNDASNGRGVNARFETVYAGSAGGGILTWSTAATSASGVVERMRIDSSGNVGIGTDSPAELLHVYDGDILIEEPDASTGGGLTIKNDSGSQLIVRGAGSTRTNPGAATGMPQIVSLSGYDLYVAADGSDDVIFTTNRTERMRIDSSGNLLVGRTSTPSGIQAGSLCINFDIHHQDAAGNDRLLYDRSANLLGNAGTNVTCATLSKSSGSFKIDHPLPEKTGTHHLVHSFVEAPQADNIYRGTVALVGGSATVNLDNAGRMSEGTFVLLNTNIQCFTTNESGWTAVKGSVSGNVLTITAKESCDDTVSWLVVGERCDQHMIDTDWTNEAGRIITEPLKGA